MRVKVIEDIINIDRNLKIRFIAREGRCGIVDEFYKSDMDRSVYIPVRLDGNKINRGLPAWNLKTLK